MAWRLKNWRWRRSATIITFFLVIIGAEFLPHLFQALTWDKLSCPPHSSCKRLLLVADPQILGEHDEPNWITIWDNDRYLQYTFTLAMSHVQPDAVVFLGDLMDEGNRADDDEFKRYVKRFFSIFHINNNLETFFLPGDNDIGGENGDPILPSTVQRFRQIFHKKAELIVGSSHIIKVNPVLEPIPQLNSNLLSSEKSIRIAVSHFPLLGMSTPFTEKILREFKPHLIFSAHSHLSRLRGPSMMSPSPLTKKLGPVPFGRKDRSKEVDFDDGWKSITDVHEIEVPTCSYRMGVSDMGFGFALIDETRNEFQYVVLWLPSRLKHLKLYMVAGIVFLLFSLWWCLCGLGKSHKYNSINYNS
ncbi:Cell division control protein 1 [Frankliniella fusca]|uniref:Cell division control protein 1 n=1 Tax=Frankliniella fusca TaxID=407009 RepID=A0AAE1H2Z7_9NEOP|nr:Cell division control protein 1 [Frankliniella fusca]